MVVPTYDVYPEDSGRIFFLNSGTQLSRLHSIIRFVCLKYIRRLASRHCNRFFASFRIWGKNYSSSMLERKINSCWPNMGLMQSNTTVSIEMFIDYKLENYIFRHFIGHRQVFSKITWDNSIYSVCARCVDGDIYMNTTCTRTIYRMILGNLRENLTMANKVPKHVVFYH